MDKNEKEEDHHPRSDLTFQLEWKMEPYQEEETISFSLFI
jgi:hypothetical protein